MAKRVPLFETDRLTCYALTVEDYASFAAGLSDPASCLGTFQIGGGTGSNEFGNISADGLYDFVYDFTNLNYYGQVRTGFLLGN